MKGLESITTEEIIKDIMTAYDKYREKWIAKFGTDKGFDDWFRTQVI